LGSSLGNSLSDPSRDRGGARERPPAPLTRSHAVKWLLLGAVGGSALTAGVMIGRDHRKLDERVPSRATLSVPSSQSMPVAPVPVSVSKDVARAPERPAERRSRTDSRGALPHRGGPAVASSTLAEEVSRIDTARIAISSGNPDGR
jgi:hypothetical protein